MICKNCGCNVKGNPHKCPLCDAVVNEEVRHVPKMKKGIGFYKNPFTLIYIVTGLAVFISISVTGISLNWNSRVWLSCLYVLPLIYFTIRHTILGMRDNLSKIVQLSIALSIFMVALFETTAYFGGYTYLFPSVCFIMFIIEVVLLCKAYSVHLPYVSSFIVMPQLSAVPLIVCAVRGLQYEYSLICCIIITIFVTITVCMYPKEILNQIKRFFAN